VVWNIVIGVAAGLVLVWVGLIAALLASKGRFDLVALRGALRLLPDLLRLIKRLAADPELPLGVRFRLWILLAYLLMPFDLVPDFIPVIGYADDAIVVAMALRSVIRHSGQDAIRRHWPGTTDGLTAILRLAGTPSA
jgi:uncharacterized membrane protein YkvA (DUF1232 family)